MVSGILRSLAPQRLAAADMLRKLNVTLLERRIEGHFITLTYGVWEPKTRILRLANAGMPLPLLVRDGHTSALHAEGVPLGLLEHVDYEEVTVSLEKGDLLAMFSDGLIEAANPEHEEFGTRRLENLFREHARRDLAGIMETVFAEIARFEQGQSRRDDQTLLLVRVR
jgi:sigma-B regulation protein RsbU (phosphoserine phosphatase)